MGLRFEAWTTPWDPGGFRRKVAMLPVLDGTGQGSVGFLSFPGDSSADISLAGFDRLDDLVSDTESSLITVFDCQPDGTNTIIDEWILNRVPSRLVPDRTVSLSGPGLLSAFEKALVYAYDYPRSPAVQADWIWGAGDDTDSTGLIRNGDFETSPLPNGGFEDGNIGYWERTEADGNLFSTSGIQAIFSAVDARSGSWYGTVLVDNQGDGIRRSISGLIKGESYTIVGWINEPTGSGDRLRAGISGASIATHSNAYEEDDYWWAEIGNATQGNGASTGSYQQVTLTFVPEGDSVELVIIYDDVNSLDFNIDDFSVTTGDNVGLDPWYSLAVKGLNPSPQQVVNVFRHDTTQSHSGSGSCRFQGVDDAYYGVFGQIGYGSIGIGQDVAMVPGRLYTYTAWVRHNGAGANGANEYLRIVLNRLTPSGPLAETITGEFRPEPGSYHMAGRTVLVPANTWTKIQLTTVADVAEIRAEVKYVGSIQRSDVGSFNSPTIWVDDVSIHEGLPATTMGDIWQKLLDDCSLHHASDGRGTVLDWIDYSSFDATNDSNGIPWDTEVTFLARWGSNMAHVLDDTFNLGYEAELVRKATPSGGLTHDFHLYNSGGRDDDPATAIHTAQPVIGGDSVKRNPSATAALVAGPDGSYTEDTDATSLANFGRLETFIQDSEATGPVSRQLLADNFFAFEAANRNAVRFEVIEAPGVPRPLVDYRPGDTIPMTMAPTLLREDRRVQRVDYVNYHPTQYVVVGSRLLEGEAAAFDLIGRMWRRMNRPGKIDDPEITPGKGEGAGGAPTVVVAASNASDFSKSKADFVCTGTDDQETIQLAIDFLGQFGGRILLTEGTFQITLTSSATLSTQTVGPTHIQGMGPDSTVLNIATAPTVTGRRLFYLGNESVVSDLEIRQQVYNQPWTPIYYIGDRTWVHRVEFWQLQCAQGHIVAVEFSYGHHVSDCHVNGSSQPFWYSEGAWNITIVDNTMDNSAGIYAEYSGGGGPGITIKGNVWPRSNETLPAVIYVEGFLAPIIEGNVTHQTSDYPYDFIEVVTCPGAIIKGNTSFQFCCGRGISVVSSPYSIVIGNQIDSFGGTDEDIGIYISNSDGCIVQGNVAQSNQETIGEWLQNGLVLNNSDFCIVSDNLLKDIFEDGLLVIDSSECQIHHNIIRNVGTSTHNTFDVIRLSGDSNFNRIDHNRLNGASASPKPRYAINISAATCDDNLIGGNDLRPLADFGTGGINDAGTNTIIEGNYEVSGGGGGSGASSSNFANFTQAGTLSTGTGTFKLPFTTDAEIISVALAVGASPTGADLIVDINKNGTTIFTTQANRPIVAAGDADGVGPEATPDVTTVSEGEYLTVDIDQIGSTIPGSDLTVTIEWRPA